VFGFISYPIERNETILPAIYLNSVAYRPA